MIKRIRPLHILPLVFAIGLFYGVDIYKDIEPSIGISRVCIKVMKDFGWLIIVVSLLVIGLHIRFQGDKENKAMLRKASTCIFWSFLGVEVSLFFILFAGLIEVFHMLG